MNFLVIFTHIWVHLVDYSVVRLWPDLLLSQVYTISSTSKKVLVGPKRLFDSGDDEEEKDGDDNQPMSGILEDYDYK